jgi:hypothetical protein
MDDLLIYCLQGGTNWLHTERTGGKSNNDVIDRHHSEFLSQDEEEV